MERTKMGMEIEDNRLQGFMAEKLNCGAALVGKRGGRGCCSTPPPPWRLEASSQHIGITKNPVREFLDVPTTFSARRLCASLWEIQPHQEAPLAKMSNVGTRLRRRRRIRSGHLHRRDDKSFEPSDGPSDQVTPTSSLVVEGGIGESSYNLRTSTELLRLLNHIRSIEEHHASNISVVKALKMELDLSRAQIKELQREKEMTRWEMENLMKKMTEDKFDRKNKAHDRLITTVESVREELEDERRLRKHSESLHRKLAWELSELKSSFSDSLRELEREKKARILLENLCDEFAKRIRDYEQEVRSLVQNSEKSDQVGGESSDRLILHISEAWLDERMQMKLSKAGDDPAEVSSVVEKLSFDIETFLHAKQSVDLEKYSKSSPEELKEVYPCQYSLDSLPLKEAISAPQNMPVEDTIEAKNFEQKRASGAGFGNVSSVNQEKEGSQNSMRQQVQSKQITEDNRLHEHEGQYTSRDDNESWLVERNLSDKTALVGETEVSTVCDATTPVPREIDRRLTGHRNSSFSSEGDRVYPESICRGDSCVHSVVTSSASPAKQWKLNLTKGVKENTLMAKLLEARLEGQKFGSNAGKSSFGSTRGVSG